jgi:hypothetical protein
MVVLGQNRGTSGLHVIACHRGPLPTAQRLPASRRSVSSMGLLLYLLSHPAARYLRPRLAPDYARSQRLKFCNSLMKYRIRAGKRPRRSLRCRAFHPASTNAHLRYLSRMPTRYRMSAISVDRSDHYRYRSNDQTGDGTGMLQWPAGQGLRRSFQPLSSQFRPCSALQYAVAQHLITR